LLVAPPELKALIERGLGLLDQLGDNRSPAAAALVDAGIVMQAAKQFTSGVVGGQGQWPIGEDAGQPPNLGTVGERG
jgi:hypothetical protein